MTSAVCFSKFHLFYVLFLQIPFHLLASIKKKYFVNVFFSRFMSYNHDISSSPFKSSLLVKNQKSLPFFCPTIPLRVNCFYPRRKVKFDFRFLGFRFRYAPTHTSYISFNFPLLGKSALRFACQTWWNHLSSAYLTSSWPCGRLTKCHVFKSHASITPYLLHCTLGLTGWTPTRALHGWWLGSDCGFTGNGHT